MKNERGLTLVELLAVLVLISLILTLVISIFISGMKASERSMTNQRLQQEANYIVETIRKEYLKLEDTGFELRIDQDSQSLYMDGQIISEGYDFEFIKDISEGDDEPELTFQIERDASIDFGLTLSEGELSYTVKTIFSKLH